MNSESVAGLMQIIGAIAMVGGGFIFAGAILALGANLTGRYGYRLFGNMTAIYKFETMQYWFRRMEKNGTHVMKKDHDKAMDKGAS